ncbi:MAG TPA: DUF5916 domain-containing protein [Longimicrobium sp.]|nr:DUF5916 domain-containing protein [Longimicrobium sp.]
MSTTDRRGRGALRALPAGLAALVALAAAEAPAQTTAAARDTPPARDTVRAAAPRLTAVRLERGASLVIDGRLDEAAWSLAVPATEFRQRRPREGAPASEATEVRFLFDDGALYVGARMSYANGTKLQAPVGRRDDRAQSDYLLVSLDPYHDRRTAYTLGVTAAGTRLDWYHPGDAESDLDATFNPVWQARTHADSGGWTAEMRIPFSQLRFNDQPSQVWGLNIRRSLPGRNEEAYWVVIPRNETGWASRFGTLEGMSRIDAARRVELVPYVGGNATVRGDRDAADPFDRHREGGLQMGADVKVGFGPNLTLDATINPDFGQVDADPAEVNLTAYETFFTERRPFFTEGSQLLAGGGPAYFYSRRIGAPPALAPDADYADVPASSTILGAAKLTGRLASGMSVGALAAVTDREFARTFLVDDSAFGRVRVAPRTGFGVARVQQEVGKGGSTVGLVLTGVHRGVDEADPEASVLHTSALAGGTDWRLRFARGRYQVRGWAGFSRVAGDSLALLRTQRSSAHYFQRPDAGHVDEDSAATSLTGYSTGLTVEKAAGRWLWLGQFSTSSPGFEINDAGRMRRADLTTGVLNLVHVQSRPGPTFREYELGVTGESFWNHGGDRTFTSLRTDALFTLKNFWTAGLSGYMDLRAQSDELTRGGPLMETSRAWAAIASLSNRAGAPTRLTGRIFYGRDERDGHTMRLSGGVAIRPDPRWRFSVEPNFLVSLDPRQFIGSLPGGPEATFGRRYVFSTIDFRSLFADVRLSYIFRPDLSLELYAQPFAASGHYDRFGEMRAAGSGDLRLYGEDGTTAEKRDDGSLFVTDGASQFTIRSREFNVREFRGNAVLRWEWRPGSTLYLVWQQNRADEDPIGDPIGARSIFESFNTRGNNFLAIKVAYWIPLH